MPFFVLFFLVPLLELTVFYYASQFIGFGMTVLLCLLSAIGGGHIVRQQGLRALNAARQQMQGGVLPSEELFNGLCIVAAGALLITPGFVTDSLGFMLLNPSVRRFLLKRFAQSARFSTIHFSASDFSGNHSSMARDPDVIEGEYEDLDKKNGTQG